MILRNATRRVVQNEIDRRKSSITRDDTTCWCPLCEADTMALTLQTLTPRYCTSFDYEKVLEKEESAKIAQTVTNSMTRIALHPKHHRLASVSSNLDLRLVNFSRKAGNFVVKSVTESAEICGCEQCQADALAYALNRYPPRYGVERNGIIDLPAREQEAMRGEMAPIISNAAQVVSRHPRHS